MTDEVEEYTISTRLCGLQNQSGSIGVDRKHSPLPKLEPWDRPAQTLVRRSTALVFFKKPKVEKISNLLTNGCCGHSCSFG
jgi:hypothetical protein